MIIIFIFEHHTASGLFEDPFTLMLNARFDAFVKEMCIQMNVGSTWMVHSKSCQITMTASTAIALLSDGCIYQKIISFANVKRDPV